MNQRPSAKKILPFLLQKDNRISSPIPEIRRAHERLAGSVADCPGYYIAAVRRMVPLGAAIARRRGLLDRRNLNRLKRFLGQSRDNVGFNNFF